jgi:hypothetical protein
MSRKLVHFLGCLSNDKRNICKDMFVSEHLLSLDGAAMNSVFHEKYRDKQYFPKSFDDTNFKLEKKLVSPSLISHTH